MSKLNMATCCFLLLLIVFQNGTVNAQSLRKFSIKLNQKDWIKSKIIKNILDKQGLVEQKKKEILRRKDEEVEKLRRKIFHEYLFKKVKGSAVVLNDFYSRF